MTESSFQGALGIGVAAKAGGRPARPVNSSSTTAGIGVEVAEIHGTALLREV